MPNYRSSDYEGIKFVFKFDDDFPDLLHIWVRHQKTIEVAIRIWCEHDSEEWNLRYQRFESRTKNEGIYWYWLKENKVVMIISCFDE